MNCSPLLRVLLAFVIVLAILALLWLVGWGIVAWIDWADSHDSLWYILASPLGPLLAMVFGLIFGAVYSALGKL